MFLSYHHRDADEVAAFVDSFGSVFSSTLSIGVSEADGPSMTLDDGLLLDRIAEKYLADSTMTIVLIGESTWARRFVDWEIAATLTSSSPRRALMGVLLQSAIAGARLPPRLESVGHESCVRSYPESVGELAGWIRDAAAAVDGSRRTHLGDLLRRDLPLS